MEAIVAKLNKDDGAYFNRLIASGSLPLVDENEVLFLFHDAEQAIKTVHLVHHTTNWAPALEMKRGRSAGPFYLRLKLPPASRLEYTFAVTYETGETETHPDPHNPVMAWCPFGPKSVATTPPYQTPAWGIHHQDVPHGIINVQSYRSRIMKDRRTFIVYEPALPPLGDTYPVLLVHDGTDYFHYAAIVDVLDNCIATKQMAPVLVVLTKPDNRNHEYTCTPEHPDYLVKELLPWLRSHYPATALRERTGLLGASFGAVASVYAAYRHPEVFGKLFLQSGSFFYRKKMRLTSFGEVMNEVKRIKNFLECDWFARGVDRRFQVYHSCGTFESILSVNRNFAEEMRKLGHTYKFRVSHDGHNWISWRDRLGDGLAYLFPLAEQAAERRDASRIADPLDYTLSQCLAGSNGAARHHIRDDVRSRAMEGNR